MPRYALDQPVRVQTTVSVPDVNGNAVLTDPGTILVRVKKPDATFLPDYTTPAHDSLGKYHQDLPSADLTQLGLYRYLWKTTGTAAGANPMAGSFTVVDPFAPSHLDFVDVRRRLNISATSDDELLDMMASAVAEQEQRVGAVAPRTVTEAVYAHYGRLSLSTRPVLAVTSATLGGVAQTTTAWTVPSAMAGLVELNSGGWWGGQLYTVTYTAGRNPVPQDLVEAALLRVQHSYATQRGGGGGGQIIGSGSNDAETGVDSSDFLLMLRAQDKEKPYVLPSIA